MIKYVITDKQLSDLLSRMYDSCSYYFSIVDACDDNTPFLWSIANAVIEQTLHSRSIVEEYFKDCIKDTVEEMCDDNVSDNSNV